MPLNIRSEVVLQLAVQLAGRRHTNKTDALRIVLENELRHFDEAVPLRCATHPTLYFYIEGVPD